MEKKHMLLLAVLTFIGLSAALGLIFYRPPVAANVEPLPVQSDGLPLLGTAPTFKLTNSAGNEFDSKTLAGKAWVADFFFSTCAGPCPKMAANMKKLHDQFETLPTVSISVNPNYDQPDVLTKYAKRFRADTSRWHFLTGDEQEILQIASKGFKVGDPDKLIHHSEKFVLVDGLGQIRGYYNGTDEKDIAKLMTDLKKL